MFYGSKQINAEGVAIEEDSATSPVDFPEVRDKVIPDNAIHLQSVYVMHDQFL